MTIRSTSLFPEKAARLSPVALARVLDQSVDCVKFIGLDGDVQYMNANGLCAMEIDDFSAIAGQDWANLWPDEMKLQIQESYPRAASGETVRFRGFCPTSKGTPRWWDVTVSAVTDDAGDHAGYLAVSRDATANEQAREALTISASELRHRLKNTYTIISSLLIGFARGNADHSAFAAEMSDRLIALGRAQALFADGEAPCTLRELVPALVMPFDNDKCHIDIRSLGEITVSQGRADAIALVIGELAVNSSKHGAVAHGGTVTICTRESADRFELIWDENCHRAVSATERSGGQGLALIRRIMATRGGTIDIAWREFGLDVTLDFARQAPT